MGMYICFIIQFPARESAAEIGQINELRLHDERFSRS